MENVNKTRENIKVIMTLKGNEGKNGTLIRTKQKPFVPDIFYISFLIFLVSTQFQGDHAEKAHRKTGNYYVHEVKPSLCHVCKHAQGLLTANLDLKRLLGA